MYLFTEHWCLLSYFCFIKAINYIKRSSFFNKKYISNYDVVSLYFSLYLMYCISLLPDLSQGLSVTQALHQVTIVTSSVSVHISFQKQVHARALLFIQKATSFLGHHPINPSNI